MKPIAQSHTITIGLAIFSMLFGAGNLIYPLKVGMESGIYTPWAIIGFMITAIILPLMGIITVILFNGDYYAFFNRLGKIPASLIICLAMLIVGPIIAIPRIITLSHIMIAPFFPFTFLKEINFQSSFLFAFFFLSITFFATYRENKIVDLLGKFISPILIGCLIIIIFKGISTAYVVVPTDLTPAQAFKNSFIIGYETLDLLGGILFGSIVLHILHNTFGGSIVQSHKKLALIALQAGTIGVALLALVYVGMSILGMYHAHGLTEVNAGQLFRIISFIIMGRKGAGIIALAVLMACLSTSIALSAVVADYFQRTIFNNTISYVTSLILVLAFSLPLSIVGLDHVLQLTAGPITYIGYPVLIMLTICNLLYKLFNFQWVKLPVFITFIIAAVSYLW